MTTKLRMAAVSLGVFLSGCVSTPAKYPTSYDQITHSLESAEVTNQDLHRRPIPKNVAMDLLPNMSSSKTGSHLIDINAQAVPAKAFFLGLFKDTPTNVLIDPKVSGAITLNLHNVTPKQALMAARDLYGYDFRKTSYGYEILPATLQSRLFTVNYLNIKRHGTTRTDVTSGEITDTISTQNSGIGTTTTNTTGSGLNTPLSNSDTINSRIKTTIEADFWKTLSDGIKLITGTDGGRSVMVDSQSGVIMVKAMPNELRAVGQFLDLAQRNLQRQVIIEAKVLEIELTNANFTGIDWNAFADALVQQGTNVLVKPEQFTDFMSINLSANGGTFSTLIHLLQTQGNVQVLSSPRISTLNNQNAVIKVGNDQFYVTSVTTNITPNGSSNTTSQSVGLTPFFTGISLDVTPQISDNGNINLHIHPAVSLVTEQNKTINLGSGSVLQLPLAKSRIRESDSVVHAHNGEYIILGGLMQNNATEESANTPGLTKVPFIGAFFRDTVQTSTKTELVILLHPMIANCKSWRQSIRQAAADMRVLERGFHVGGTPEIYGDMGEEGD